MQWMCAMDVHGGVEMNDDIRACSDLLHLLHELGVISWGDGCWAHNRVCRHWRGKR